MESLKQFIRTNGSSYLQDKNVSSIGVGYKVKDGKPTKEIAIQFTVKKKASPEVLELLGTQPIPETITVDGVQVPTDVIQRSYAPCFRVVAEAAGPLRKSRIEPIIPGVSVANTKETAGTIGCIVFDRNDGTPYVLSNWHVLQGPHGVLGDDIVQPGPHDDNRVQLNRMGKLVRSHLGVAGDCAVSSIEDRSFNSEILGLGVAVEQLGEPELDDKVIKSGRTTAVTHGIVRRVHTMAKIDYGEPVGDKEIGCFEIGTDPEHLSPNEEVSQGGDSGAVWLFKSASGGKPTKIMAGLHFAGEGAGDPDEHALACYPSSVFEKLEITLDTPETLTPPGNGAVEAAGSGYNANFLGQRIDIPKLNPSVRNDAFKLNGSDALHYMHFSLALSKSRRFAFWVAWNIDGSRLKKVSRKGIPFILDPRVSDSFQVGDELYEGNRLDRGHIARRADLLWGSLTEAKRANKDSFFFTNITPQMDDFNQSGKAGLWGQLEDAVFSDVDVDNLRVNVYGGPVFQDNDRVFKQVRIPREFWKVLAFVENGTLKSKAFVLTQNLDQLEALELDEFRVFQLTLSEVEQRCHLRFPDELRDADGFAERMARRPEALAERKPLESLDDIEW
jgi:endonuclease G